MKRLLILTVVVAVALAAAAVYLYERGTAAGVRADAFARVADSLRTADSVLQGRVASLNASIDSQVAAASHAKEDEINRLKSTYDELEKNMKDEIAQGQIQITRLADRLKVSMVDRILFPSGEAEISPAGRKILRRVGDVLKSTTGKVIRVEGHTDSVAISPALKGRFPTNWELSTTRATNVVRFLQDSVGIDPTRLRAVGLSEYHPVASNQTAKGRAQNRRIEIGLLPESPLDEQ
ncbi:MAG TPA: OmpA family protein [Gemmatimonadales bacterium]|nr:OmpA family protein [Gemmatimonadales bacterium]